MGDPAIKVENVGKLYTLGEGRRYDRQFSRRVSEVVGAPVLRLLGKKSSDDGHVEPEEFWALRNVSLEVEEGQVLGLIGANGAGKSTLLKMLARITPPTEGRITLHGQVGSLLEVGTGFHPELTGRENIFLNGSILGMRRQEIESRYDEIVEFSGIEQFIETPVKRYSSGMFVRLAFAVAAHLDPEILLIDEVLSVGDAVFQRKCLKKMEEIAHSDGRTIVFVSHGLGSIKELCDRVVVIEDGHVVADGAADTMTANYMERVEPVQHGGVSLIHTNTERTGTGEARVMRVALRNDDGEAIDSVHFGEPFIVDIEVEATEDVFDVVFMVVVSTADGARALSANSTDRGASRWRLQPGRMEVHARLEVTLLPGEFVIDVAAVHADGRDLDYVERAIAFTALRDSADGGADRYPWSSVHGSVRGDATWSSSDASLVRQDEGVAT